MKNQLASALLLALLCGTTGCSATVVVPAPPSNNPSGTPIASPSPSPSTSPTPSPSPSATAAPATLNTPFSLKGGSSAVITSENLTVTFEQVVQDSRCPSDVQCIRAGDVTVRVSLTQPSGSQNLELTLGGAAELKQGKFGKYTVELQDVKPTSKKSTDNLTLTDYTITLLVRG